MVRSAVLVEVFLRATRVMLSLTMMPVMNVATISSEKDKNLFISRSMLLKKSIRLVIFQSLPLIAFLVHLRLVPFVPKVLLSFAVVVVGRGEARRLAD